MMKKMVMFLGLIVCLCVPSVQANEDKDQLDWSAMIQEAHETQAQYSQEFVDYTTMRTDFLKYFTKEAMMSIFMEHVIIYEEQYKLASTDFSPYILPSMEWTSFHVEQKNDNEIIVKEDDQEPTELMGPQQVLRKITFSQTEEGWRISQLDWEVKSEQKTHED